MVKVGGDNRDFGIPFCVRSCIHKISRENNIILHSKFCAKTYHRQTFPVLYFCTEKQDMGNWACYINVLIRWKTWIADVLVHCMTRLPPQPRSQVFVATSNSMGKFNPMQNKKGSMHRVSHYTLYSE